MEIKVLGSGCANCKKLYALTQDAVKELGVNAEVLYVTDLQEIMKTGIMRMPGMMINGKVKVMGRVPALAEIKRIISDEQA